MLAQSKYYFFKLTNISNYFFNNFFIALTNHFDLFLNLMATKIYTKTGDKGLTGLIGGERVSKSDLRVVAYGVVDELNSHIGLIKDLNEEVEANHQLLHIQNILFVIGSQLANTGSKPFRMELPELKNEEIIFLEKAIDKMTEVIPELKHFILPGGHILVSHTHIARCVCRRAETACVELEQKYILQNSPIIAYLNRLSDYLFVLARYFAQQLNVSEIKWKPNTNCEL